MKGYEKYKTSKFLWFDKLPENWIEGKIKYLFEISRGRVISQLELKPEAKYPVYSSQTKNDGCLGYIETFDYEGEMLTWTTDGANAGSVFQRKGQFNCTNVCGILTPKQELGLRYYFYYVDFIAQFYKRPDTNGAKIMSNEMAEIHCFIPSLEEQTAIASFLDYKTNLIDAIIEKKKRLIDLLKEKRQAVINEAVTKGLNPNAPMKESGVEWLGEIPEHWEVSYFKHYLSLKGRLGWKGLKAEEYVENSGYGFLSTPDIKNDEIDFNSINNITEERYLESPEIMLQRGDVLLVKDGSTLGITNIVKELPIKTTVNSSIGVLRVYDENKLLPNYLLIYLRSNLMQGIINQLKAGQGVPHLFQKDIKNFCLIVPPIIEQNKIIEKINKSDEEIRLLISKIESAIEKLQTYRQSLISEAVTGKIDVRDWEIPVN